MQTCNYFEKRGRKQKQAENSNKSLRHLTMLPTTSITSTLEKVPELIED